jgi:integrase
MAITDAEIRSFKPAQKRYRHSDGHGLYIDVMPSGKKVFRLAYRLGKSQRTTLIGTYPDTSLADARIQAAVYKSSLRDGIDPREEKRAEAAKVEAASNEPLWRDIARDYLILRQRSGAAPRTVKKLTWQIETTMEGLGKRRVSSILAQDVLAVVNPIAESGRVESAHEIRGRISQIFRYAGARGLVENDPAAMISGAMIKRRRGEFQGITEPSAVGRLMRDLHIYRSKHFAVGAALLLSAYLFPRNSEIRGLRWTEINWAAALWEIPGERMKMKRDHVVPLPTQAVEILKELNQYDFGSELAFCSPINPKRSISDATLNSALRRMGYTNDQHVHHGFRTTASTNLNEMGWNSDWIEAQLAHVSSNKVRASYNKAKYLEGRAEMMQAYADWLDLRANLIT